MARDIDHEYSFDRAQERVDQILELLQEIANAGQQAMLDPGLDHLQATLTWLAWVALGSALGGTARFFLSGFVGRRIGETFPWGTMTVNVTGAFAIGIIAAAADRHAAFHLPDSWQFVVVGILGSYTTVSSVSLQTLALARDGEYLRASGNMLLSLTLCLSAVALGFIAGSVTFGLGAP